MLVTWFWIVACAIEGSKMMTLGPKLGAPPVGGALTPDTVNCSHVLGEARLAIRTPAMLRSAETHWLLDSAWKDTVPLAWVTMRNFSLVPMAACDAMSRPPLARSVVTKRPLTVAWSEVVPSLLLTTENCSQPLAVARLATRKLAPAFSALTKLLLAEAWIVAALAAAGRSHPASSARIGVVMVFDMNPPECGLAAPQAKRRARPRCRDHVSVGFARSAAIRRKKRQRAGRCVSRLAVTHIVRCAQDP